MRRMHMRICRLLVGVAVLAAGGCAPLPLASEATPAPRESGWLELGATQLRFHDPSGRLRELDLPGDGASIQLDARPRAYWPSFLDAHELWAGSVPARDAAAPPALRLVAASLDSPGSGW